MIAIKIESDHSDRLCLERTGTHPATPPVMDELPQHITNHFTVLTIPLTSKMRSVTKICSKYGVLWNMLPETISRTVLTPSIPRQSVRFILTLCKPRGEIGELHFTAFHF